MSFHAYLLVMAFASVAAWGGWIITLVSIDPAKAGPFGLVIFYLTLTIALIGTLSVMLAQFRAWLYKNELVSRHVGKALRQSVLLSCLVVGSLILLGNDLFNMITTTLFISFLALIELAFIKGKKARPESSEHEM